MNTPHNVKFSFYGFGVEVNCQNQNTLLEIKRDYSFFLSGTTAAKVFFEVSNEAPDYSKFSSAKVYSYTPQSICYRYKELSIIDYFGKALVIIDHRRNIYKVFCPKPHLRHEIVFLFIMALAGRNFDLRNLHRVHGLGLEVNNKASLILLPSGGGKTTLFLDIIKDTSVKLISEDSPLIDASGKALPFPIRIGVSAEDKPQGVPEEHLHLVKRVGFKPKYAIDVDIFKDKIAREPFPVRYILCGVRSLGSESYIKSLAKHQALGELLKKSVLGEGLYQGADFVPQAGIWGTLKKSPMLLSRLRNAAKALCGSKVYSFVFGSDRRKNAETFLNFCKDHT